MCSVVLKKEKIEQAFMKVKSEISIDGLDLVLIQEHHYDAVISFLREHFIPDEPLNMSLGTVWDDDNEHVFRKALEHNLSIMAVSDSGEIAGVRVITVLNSGSATDTNEIKCESLKTIRNFLRHVGQKMQIYTHYDVSEVVYFFALATSRKFRRRGIGTQLLAAGVVLGTDLGYKVIKGEGTSKSSQRIYQKLDFDSLVELPYEEYTINGEVVFKNMGDNTSIIAYGKRL